MSKSGFSTLNRWLGRKNKDKSTVNGNLSKSSINLSISSTNINETSQLEYNRITPLPAATTNAPFEQTFRITVLLPKDQLYVTRLGARVPLRKLLELVCDNKLLDEEKYEFRNPVDTSKVYSCDLTIGAVGLSEIRLCHKSESYDNFNSDEIIKLHRTSQTRESLSSSEFSSRNSKHTTKTTSPYSSTNSLNSMDSSAVSCGRSAKLSLNTQPKITAPPRKKRAAPRPPSQTAIPEKSPLIMEQNYQPTKETPLNTKDFSMSTPNLISSTMLHSDINGNDCNGSLDENNDMSSGNGSLNSNGYNEDTVLYAQVQKKNALNLKSPSKQDLADSCNELNTKLLPEPSPRKKLVQIKKKTTAPPAPTPRNSMYQDDAVSIASTNVSSNSTPSISISSTTKSPLENFENSQQEIEESENISNDIPKPVPRITTTSTTLLNATDIELDLKHITSDSETSKVKTNISKVMLNRTPTPEPRSLSSEPPEIEHCYNETQLEELKQQQRTEEDCVSKQADSGIGEPVPSPIPDTQSPELSTLDVKSHFESSSDDDDMVKVYNFKLGKTLVKPVGETKSLEELTIMNGGQEETDSELSTPLILTQITTPNNLSETSSWNFTIPISPPPNFADTKFIDNISNDPKSDIPITPIIMERPILNFENIKHETESPPDPSPTNICNTPLSNIVDELSSIIQDKGVDSLIKKPANSPEIEAAKPNTLSNFSINAIVPSSNTKPKEIATEKSIIETEFTKASTPLSSNSLTIDDDKLYRKRNSVTSLRQRRSVTRSDSFHTTAAPHESINLNKRTSSHLSLDQIAGNLNCRRSSSELSIGESPSLQSLEIIKNILNSRKNSLANSSGEEDKEIKMNTRRPSEELQFASLELKTTKSLEKNDKEKTLPEDEHNGQKTKNVFQEDKPKELPKVYRYSGPPSINFSTWSERPKSHVAIKNEGDYIFGGVNGNKDIKNYCTSMAVTKSEIPPVAGKPAIIKRMGIPEQSYKVPLLVRPLQDVVVDKVSVMPSEGTSLNGQIKSIQNPNTEESLLKGQIRETSNTNILLRNINRPTVHEVLRPQTQTISNTYTLPRANKQRFSTSSGLAGTQLLRSASTKQQQESETVTNNQTALPGPQILRCSSIKHKEFARTPSPTIQAQQAPFGQNTLRRTGFKEKILANEQAENQTFQNTHSTTLSQENSITNGDLKLSNQKFIKSLTSAKLHLNLKGQQGPTTNSSCVNIIVETPALKPKPTTPKTAPVFATCKTFALTSNTTSLSTPTPPAMNIQLKPLTQLRTSTRTEDSRDELLTAIRNFNREGLKKA